MNYPLMSGIHDFFLDTSMDKESFEYMVNRCYTMYMQQNNNVMFNLLDSHDTERLMNRFHDLDIFYQQLAILFTLPGSPCIYYGTEIALEEDTIRIAGVVCHGIRLAHRRIRKGFPV